MSEFALTAFDGHAMRVDHEADMGYIRLRVLPPDVYVHRTDLTHRFDGVLVDRDADGNIWGIEVFLRHGKVRPESADVIRRLLAKENTP